MKCIKLSYKSYILYFNTIEDINNGDAIQIGSILYRVSYVYLSSFRYHRISDDVPTMYINPNNRYNYKVISELRLRNSPYNEFQ